MVRSPQPLLTCALFLAACGSTVVQSPHTATVVRVGQGPAVTVVSTAPAGTRQAVQLALFIDAGTRDASTPRAAVIAAELLGKRVGRDARARALPDGIEVITLCDDGLAACAKRLARGLMMRTPSAVEIARANERITTGARAARAGDPQRSADELALHALWPDDAASFLPLDSTPIAGAELVASVHAFIADSFGTRRALLAASGAVALPPLQSAVQHAFVDLPRAESARAARALPESERASSVEVAVDNVAGVSLALSGGDLVVITRAAVVLREELLRSKHAASVVGHTSSVRGGALAILRVQSTSTDAAALVRRIGYLVERIRIEGLPATALPLERDEPLAVLQRTGARFAAGVNAVKNDAAVSDLGTLRVGIGVLVRGARADAVTKTDPDAGQRDAERKRFAQALDDGARLATPELEGEQGSERASVTLANHGRVAVDAGLSDQVAIAVTFGLGAEGDPPEQHGRAALLAQTMTVACAGRSPLALRAELTNLGATLEPVVQANTLGIVLRAPSQHARAAIDLAIECGLSPSLARGDVIRARLLVRERLGAVADTGRLPLAAGDLRAQVARVLSIDRRPGALAPWGASSTLASVDERALAELLARALRGPNVSVAIVGGLETLGADGAAQLAARRLSRLSSDAFKEPVALAKTAPKVTARPKSATKASANPSAAPAPLPPQAVEALLVWSAPACPASSAAQTDAGSSDAARALAAALSLALASRELHVPWLDGDCAAGSAWSALLVRGPAERIATITTGAIAASRRIDARATAAAAASAARDRAATGGGISERAQALAGASLDRAGAAAPLNDPSVEVLIGRLLAGPVRVLAVE